MTIILVLKILVILTLVVNTNPSFVTIITSVLLITAALIKEVVSILPLSVTLDLLVLLILVILPSVVKPRRKVAMMTMLVHMIIVILRLDAGIVM